MNTISRRPDPPDPGIHPPIAAWDASDWTYWSMPSWKEKCVWVERVLGCSKYVYRVEFYLIDVPFMVVYRYELDGNGAFLIRDEQVAKAEPAIVVLSQLPPENLL